jgi:hypothetical protein
MRANVGVALPTFLLLSVFSAAQTIHLSERYSRVKVENGLILGWHVNSADSQAPQITVYDSNGHILVALYPLRLVPGASEAFVHDVSARPGGVIAVAAAYRKDNASVPAFALLLFDFKGNPLTTLALAPSRQAWRVTLDSESNLWTLTAGAGGLSPSEAPMVVGYTASGSVLKEVLSRSEFPLHASETQENPKVGAPGLGVSSRAIWFWLPGSTDLVTFYADGSGVQRSMTGLPKSTTAERVVRTDAGTLLAQVRNEQDSSKGRKGSFFLRSAVTKTWNQFYAPCACTLIGADSADAFFIQMGENGSDIYKTHIPE